MNRAERRRREREQQKLQKNGRTQPTSESLVPGEHPHFRRQRYIEGLIADALVATTGTGAISVDVAIARATRGDGPFWTFRPKRTGKRITGGDIFVVEHFVDPFEGSAPGETWRIWTEGGDFADEVGGTEDTYSPGDDLSDVQDLRFIPVAGIWRSGMLLPFTLAMLLGRAEDESTDRLR